MPRRITNLKIQTNVQTEERFLDVWFDNGDTVYTRCTPEVQNIVNEWKTGNINDEQFANAINKATASYTASQVQQMVLSRVEKFTERISSDGLHIYFDNDTINKVSIDPTIEDHMVRLLTQRKYDAQAAYDWKCWCAFVENLYDNVDQRIREQIVQWLSAQGLLTFTEDGCIIGYRGCQINPDTGVAESIHCGPGIVNGEIYNGHIPNPDGAVVEMQRSKVENNPSVGCASGLHVGTYDYAAGWGNGIICRVKVNPKDIISVPFDCNAQKIRCCRFTVLDHELYTAKSDITWDQEAMSWRDEEDEWDDYCDDCCGDCAQCEHGFDGDEDCDRLGECCEEDYSQCFYTDACPYFCEVECDDDEDEDDEDEEGNSPIQTSSVSDPLTQREYQNLVADILGQTI